MMLRTLLPIYYKNKCFMEKTKTSFSNIFLVVELLLWWLLLTEFGICTQILRFAQRSSGAHCPKSEGRSLQKRFQKSNDKLKNNFIQFLKSWDNCSERRCFIKIQWMLKQKMKKLIWVSQCSFASYLKEVMKRK